MKRINVIFIFTVLLSLSSCMPDSLTKFEEKSTKKQREKLSGGGTTGEGSVSHISSVYYNQAKGQKLVLKLSNSSEYALDGFISAEPGNVNGVTGKINYIEGSDIYAEITTTTITKDTNTFQKDTPVDNVEEYFTEEGTVSDGDTVTVRQTSAATQGTSKVTTLTVGSMIRSFTTKQVK